MLCQNGLNIRACSQETTPQSKAKSPHSAAILFYELGFGFGYHDPCRLCHLSSRSMVHIPWLPRLSEFHPSDYVIRNRAEESLPLTLRL